MAKSTDVPLLSSDDATCPGGLGPLAVPCIGRRTVMYDLHVCTQVKLISLRSVIIEGVGASKLFVLRSLSVI